jgi:predicted nucleotidyltransferase
MSAALRNDPVLSRFREAVAKAYGDRLARVVLFGSRARGEERPDSDYDVAVFLWEMPDRVEEMDRLADIATDILYDAGRVIHAMPYPADFPEEASPLMREIRRDGIEL